MPNSTIQVIIETPHWLTRNVFYVPKHLSNIFPADALGARGEEEEKSGLYPKRGKPISLCYGYGIEDSECDLATDKFGKMRPRESGPVRLFYDAASAKVGDYLTITNLGERRFEIRLVKTTDAAV